MHQVQQQTSNLVGGGRWTVDDGLSTGPSGWAKGEAGGGRGPGGGVPDSQGEEVKE